MKLPKVKFEFSTVDGLQPFEITVRVSQNFKFYFATKELPEALRTLKIAPHAARVYADTFYELETEIQKLITEIETSTIEALQSRVILYEVNTDSNREACQKIDFRWLVCQKVTLGTLKGRSETKYYREREHSGGHTISRTMDLISESLFDGPPLEMEWTAEREAWFRGMESSVESLGRRLKRGFGKYPDLLARKIDQGAQFLLNSSEGD